MRDTWETRKVSTRLDHKILRGETLRGETLRGETLRGETLRGETLRGETLRGETRVVVACPARVGVACSTTAPGRWW